MIEKENLLTLWHGVSHQHGVLVRAFSNYFSWFDAKMRTHAVTDSHKGWVVLWSCFLAFHLNTIHRLFANGMDVMHLEIRNLNSRWQAEWEPRITDSHLCDPENFEKCLAFLMYCCPVCGRQPGCFEFCVSPKCNNQREPTAGAIAAAASKKANAKAGGTTDPIHGGIDQFAKHQNWIKRHRQTITHSTSM
jgi:hypothetical protein